MTYLHTICIKLANDAKVSLQQPLNKYYIFIKKNKKTKLCAHLNEGDNVFTVIM